MKQRVLSTCIYSSACSQMAGALLNQICSAFFEAQSAGLRPGKLNPLAIKVLIQQKIEQWCAAVCAAEVV